MDHCLWRRDMLPAPSPKETCEDEANEAKRVWPQFTAALESRGYLGAKRVPCSSSFEPVFLILRETGVGSVIPVTCHEWPGAAPSTGSQTGQVARSVMVGLVGVSPGQCWASFTCAWTRWG